MKLTLVMAYAANDFAIGYTDGRLLSRQSEDLKRFKSLTLNKPVIMGVNTFLSLPSYLPNRPHLVICRNVEDLVKLKVGFEEKLDDEDDLIDESNLLAFASIQDAIDFCKDADYKEACIIGGGKTVEKVYEDPELSTQLTGLYLTMLIETPETAVSRENAVYCPALKKLMDTVGANSSGFNATLHSRVNADDKNQLAYRFFDFEKGE